MGHKEQRASQRLGFVVAVAIALVAHVGLAAIPVSQPDGPDQPGELKVVMRFQQPPPPKPKPQPKRVTTPEPKKVTPPKPRPRRRRLTATRRRTRQQPVLPKPEPKKLPEPETRKLEPPPPPQPPKPPKKIVQPTPPTPPKAKPARKVSMGPYLRSLYRSVVRHKHYPAAAKRLRLQGRVLVRMRIDRSGKLVAKPEIKRSSGHRVLDHAALRIVAAAAPFGSFPTGYHKTTVKIVVPVDFRLRDGG